jgi:hypothetical protein
MLQEGIPSVVLVHEHFEALARKELRLLGIEDSSNIVIAYPADRPATDSLETVLLKAREQVDKLEGMLTSQKWQPESSPSQGGRRPPQAAAPTRQPPTQRRAPDSASNAQAARGRTRPASGQVPPTDPPSSGPTGSRGGS